MKQQQFEKTHRETWEAIESSLEQENSARPVDHYLLLCQHVAIARQRRYDLSLSDRLNELATRMYRTLSRKTARTRFNPARFVVREFPVSLYRHRWYFALACAVFLVPLLLSGYWAYLDEGVIYSVVEGFQVRSMEAMYDPSSDHIGQPREAESDIFMFGYYIKNNIGIAFDSFAGGLLLGVGSLAVLAFNGLYIGMIAGHLTRIGFGETFYPFVSGHGSFELTAIVLSGAAGLKLGFSLLLPGALSRTDALRQAGRESVPMLYGITAMLLIAAVIEAFWSSSTAVTATTKYAMGAVGWALVLLYIAWSLRRGPR